MTTEQLTTLQETHLAAWNERDRAKRDALIDRIYADDIRMYDPAFILHGKTAISDFIDKVQTDPAFHFAAARPMEFTQNGVRLFWTIRLSDKPAPMTGMDFFMLEEGKVLHLYVFMEG